jgi:hypothetical protein
MPETSPSAHLHFPPETLYRGIVIPVDLLSEDLLNRPLMPGAEPRTDEQGRAVVSDGNEYGVYMTDNQFMADKAYATPRRGDPIPNSPVFNSRYGSQGRVEMPRAGLLYEIGSRGLDVRKPFITDYLKGVYNNGFEGDEWISDSVPVSQYRLAKVQLGADLIHPSESFTVEDNGVEVVKAVREKAAARAGKLALVAERIEALPGNRRASAFHIDRLLHDMRSENSRK